MIYSNNTEVINCITDEYREKMAHEFKLIQERHARFFWIKVLLMVGTGTVIGFLLFSLYKKISDMLKILQGPGDLLIPFLMCLLTAFIVYLLYRFLKRLERRMNLVYSAQRNHINERLYIFFCIMATFADLKADKVGIKGLTDKGFLIEKTKREPDSGKQIEVIIPYNVIISDDRKIEFYDEYVDLYIDQDTLNLMKGLNEKG